MNTHITRLKGEFQEALAAAKTAQELEQVRIAFLGRSGSLAKLMAEFKMLPTEEKREVGPALQKLKAEMQESFEAKQQHLADAAIRQEQEKQKHFDVTAYKPRTFTGGLHVYTRIIDNLTRIFISMGYAIAQGPEVETEFHNFEALNIPADHPARDMQDTFWLRKTGMLLRTHTSPVQIRAMEKHGAPIAVFAPGRVYRHEQADASHDFMFTQGEALLVGKNISMSNLLATAQEFLQAVFETKDLKIRVRPGYFPFVEPGIEIDASCTFCSKGCSTCKRTGWIELLGAGLVHPNVLRAAGVDPEIYSGFAIGLGVERLAMIKFGINDVRLFHSGNIDFLRQF